MIGIVYEVPVGIVIVLDPFSEQLLIEFIYGITLSMLTLVVQNHELKEPARLGEILVAPELLSHEVLDLLEGLVLAVEVVAALEVALEELLMEVEDSYSKRYSH